MTLSRLSLPSRPLIQIISRVIQSVLIQTHTATSSPSTRLPITDLTTAHTPIHPGPSTHSLSLDRSSTTLSPPCLRCRTGPITRTSRTNPYSLPVRSQRQGRQCHTPLSSVKRCSSLRRRTTFTSQRSRIPSSGATHVSLSLLAFFLFMWKLWAFPTRSFIHLLRTLPHDHLPLAEPASPSPSPPPLMIPPLIQSSPDYRQNPTKIYNGVRHQTSMCKAFVKLPRPFGDQSGGARKWAIRAGCETWFSGGGYHPPGSLPVPQVQGRKAGKAKSTARSKQLAIGTEDFPKSVTPYSAGPSSGPAFDGSTRPTAYQQTGYHGPGFLPPGYHYVPVPPSHGHGHNHAQAHNGQPVYVPIWGPYPPPGPDPNIYRQQAQAQGYSSSPEQWRQQYEEHRGQYLGNGHEDPRGNYDAFRESPVTVQGSRGSSYGPSSEGH